MDSNESPVSSINSSPLITGKEAPRLILRRLIGPPTKAYMCCTSVNNSKEVSSTTFDNIFDAITDDKPNEIDTSARLLTVYHDDEDTGLLIVHKPANMAVEGPQNSILDVISTKHTRNKEIISSQQIDFATSGVTVLAKNNLIEKGLKKLFKKNHIKQLYVAVVRGWIEKDTMVCEFPISEEENNDKSRMKINIPNSCPLSIKNYDKKENIIEPKTKIHVIKRGYLTKYSTSCSKCSFIKSELAAARNRIFQDVCVRSSSSESSIDSANVRAVTDEYIRMRTANEVTSSGICPNCEQMNTKINVTEEEENNKKVTLIHLEVEEETYRHHLRVHLSALGHPIVGDPLYEEEPPKGYEKIQIQKDSATDLIKPLKEELKEEKKIWPYEYTKKHRLLLHCYYILIPLHRVSYKKGLKNWMNVDIVVEIPSAFERLVECSCEIRSPECSCSVTSDSSARSIIMWEQSVEPSNESTINDLNNMALKKARELERQDRKSQRSSYEYFRSSIDAIYEEAIRK